jgi:DNA-binding LytR/AlgR family response regulator
LAIGLEAGQPTYRILVVEDKWANRQLLVRLLAPLGFDVREATNGQEAIALWQNWHPHLIWMDMRMPVMDGYEATREIKARSGDRSPPSNSFQQPHSLPSPSNSQPLKILVAEDNLLNQKLILTSAVLGADRFSQLCQELENMGKTGIVTITPEFIDRIETEYKRVKLALESERQKAQA